MKIKDEINRIEKELKENAHLLIQNRNTFTRKYRGTEEMDVLLSFRELKEGLTIIFLYVADEYGRINNRYHIEDNKLIKTASDYSKGHKRVYQ